MVAVPVVVSDGVGWHVIVTVASAAFTRWIAKGAGASDVLGSEAAAWRLGTWRGIGMVAGFAILALVERSRWSWFAPYVDPAMVLVSGAALVSGPVAMVRTGGVELLEAAPGDHIRGPIASAVDEVRTAAGFDEPELVVSKVGRRIYVEVVASAEPSMTIAEEQAARDHLERLLHDLPYDIWLTLELQPRRAG